MTHVERLQTAQDAGLIKSAVWHRLLGAGFKHGAKRLGARWNQAKGFGNRVKGTITGNEKTKALGRMQRNEANLVIKPIQQPKPVPRKHNPQTGWSKLDPRNWWGMTKHTGTKAGRGIQNFWGANQHGVQGFGQHMAYAAGRAPGIALYGAPLAVAPYIPLQALGQARGTAHTLKNAPDYAYKELGEFAQRWDGLNAGQRFTAAARPDLFHQTMMSPQYSSPQLSPYDRHLMAGYAQNAHNRLTGQYQKPSMFQSAQSLYAYMNPLAIALQTPKHLRGDMIESQRDIFDRFVADKISDRAQAMFMPKSASHKEQFEKAAIIRAAVGATRMIAPGMWRRIGQGLWQNKGKALGAAALPTAFGYMSYVMPRNTSAQHTAGQIRGTTRAGISNYWNQMPAYQRYGAALFPTAAKMKMEKSLGPGYQAYMQRQRPKPQPQAPPQAPQQPPLPNNNQR